MISIRFHTCLTAAVFVAVIIGTGFFADLSTQEEGKEISYWTCGMHPSVRSETAGKCPICNMDLVPVYEQPKEPEQAGEAKAVELVISPDAARLTRIRTVEVTRRELAKTIRAAGRISYDETRLAAVSARFGGRIEKLYADYTGKEFAAGEPLASIYSPELLSAQKEFILARGSALEPAAREKLRLWGITEAQIVELARRGEPWTALTIYAPIGGTVIHKNIVEGDYVKVGDPLVHLADLDRVWIVADIFEHDFDAVVIGRHVIISSETRPGETFDGTVMFIEPFLDTKTRSAKIRIEADNADRALRPGMFVRVEIHSPIVPTSRRETMIPDESKHRHTIADDDHDARDATGHNGHAEHDHDMIPSEASEPGGILAVPRSAIINTGARTVAFVEIEPGRYELRRVRIGPMAEGYYVILDGLAEGERVVERGSFLLDSQTRLTGEAEEVYGGAIGKERGKNNSNTRHRH